MCLIRPAVVSLNTPKRRFNISTCVSGGSSNISLRSTSNTCVWICFIFNNTALQTLHAAVGKLIP